MTGCCCTESVPMWMTPGYAGWVRSMMDSCCCADYPSSSTSDCLPEFSGFEKDGKYHIRAEMPCFDKDHVEVSAHEGRVTIKGSTAESCEDYGGSYSVKECHTGHFEKEMGLPADADPGSMHASFKDGVLDIEVSHKEASPPTEVKIS